MEVIESGASGLLKWVEVSLATNVFIKIYGGLGLANWWQKDVEVG
jgi:hypothetical protein